MPRIAALYERIGKLEQRLMDTIAVHNQVAADLSGELAGVSAQLTMLMAQLQSVQADLVLVHSAFNSHVSNNSRHTGTLIGGLL